MKNPTWQRDELILALDVYFRENYNNLSASHPAVKALSHTLNLLPIFSAERRGLTFRNPDGVYMKLGNFLAIDPDDKRRGLPSYGKLDKVIFFEFHQDKEQLHRLAEAIQASVLDEATRAQLITIEEPEDESYTAKEGAVLLKVHKYRERNQQLVKKKKETVLRKTGFLACEVCGFRFDSVYGKVGSGYIECHHISPVHLMEPGQHTRLSDLALVCANCHRMLHRDLTMSLATLRTQLKRS